jgi:anti-sigma regulatory factor (Ser/Thr protein kinase)
MATSIRSADDANHHNAQQAASAPLCRNPLELTPKALRAVRPMKCHNREFPAVDHAVGEARAWTRALLFPQTPAATVHDAQVIVSELATNCVRHTRGPCFRLDVAVSAFTFYVECIDAGGRTEPHLPDADPWAEAGRGLRLIAALADVSGPLAQGGRYFAFLRWTAAPPH